MGGEEATLEALRAEAEVFEGRASHNSEGEVDERRGGGEAAGSCENKI